MADTPQLRISAGLAAIWQRQQPQVLERLAQLEAAAANPRSEALQKEAAATAHKLAGMLGMFGFAHGTDIARELEQHLESAIPDADTLIDLTRRLREAVFPRTPGEQSSLL